MAGYIGSSAPVNLSTTSADIDGTLNVDGDIIQTGGDEIQNSGTLRLSGDYDASGAGNVEIKTKGILRQQIANGGSISFYEDTGTTAKFFWDASAESLGIGTSSPAGILQLQASNPNMYITSANTGQSDIYFGGTTSPTKGRIQYSDNSDLMAFWTDSTERIRIDSSGNLLVGKTSANSTAGTGFEVRPEGTVIASRDSNDAAIFNRDGTDGDIAVFRKDGTTVGSIGSRNGASLTVSSSGSVNIYDTSASAGGIAVSSNIVYPINNTGGTDDDLMSLGSASVRFKDLYLSGGVSNPTGSLTFDTNGSERMRIDSSGHVLVGTTDAGVYDDATDEAGHNLLANGQYFNSTASEINMILNRQNTDGDILQFRKNGTTVGSIQSRANAVLTLILDPRTPAPGVGSGIGTTNDGIVPADTSGLTDNKNDLGKSGNRWDDVYATNGTIQTSDQNEKQQIASLTDAEITAAKAISKLFKTFKWNDSVAEKGDAARTHSGVIAQEVEQAMTDAGLNAGDYAFFISTTWWETQTEVPAVEAVAGQDAVYEDVIIPAVEEVLDEEGNVVTEAQPERTEQRLVSEAVEAVEAQEAYTRTDTYYTAEEAPEGATERNRKGIRYPQLLSFIGAATEQRLASIESRLDALESA